MKTVGFIVVGYMNLLENQCLGLIFPHLYNNFALASVCLSVPFCPRPVRHTLLKIAVTLLFSILETWDSQEMILTLFYNGFLRF